MFNKLNEEGEGFSAGIYKEGWWKVYHRGDYFPVMEVVSL